MKQVVIDNPILNSPLEEPTRHFRSTDDGITNETVPTRRLSGYFVPILQPRVGGKQLTLEAHWTQDRFQESEFINHVRDRIKVWREQGWPGVTNLTSRFLEHWTNTDRERRLSFCQIEALETAIYLTEIAAKQGDAWIANLLRKANEGANPGLYRIAIKMATGSQIQKAAKEALRGIGYDLLLVLAFAFDAHAGEIANEISPADLKVDAGFVAEYQEQYGRLPVLLVKMNPGNLFMVFGEPDLEIVRHAYFTEADEPYDKLKKALRVDIDETAWQSLYSTRSRPFDQPKTGKIAVKVINHYGDEVLKVYDMQRALGTLLRD